MNVLLLVLQVVLGVYFTAVGVMHFIVPPGLPAMMAWMYELPAWLHYLSGTAEILGGLGLILPRIFRVQQRLVPLAGAGLAAVMVAATVWHLPRGEAQNIVFNLVLGGLVLFVAVAYARGPLRALRSGAARP